MVLSFTLMPSPITDRWGGITTFEIKEHLEDDFLNHPKWLMAVRDYASAAAGAEILEPAISSPISPTSSSSGGSSPAISPS